MKKETYNSIILTVIAICLSIIVLKDVSLFPSAYANNPIEKVEFNKNYGLVPLNKDGSINVKLSSQDVIDVRLRGIDESSSLRWEAIKVKVEN